MADRMSRSTLIIQELVRYECEKCHSLPVRSGIRGVRQWEVYDGPHAIDDYIGSIFYDTRKDVWTAKPARSESSDHTSIHDAVRELMRWT